MRVTFTKVDAKRYAIAIEREHGPPLVPRFAPGFDDLMPHDLAHFLVEEHFRIELGVWGQLASGGAGVFTPAPADNTLGQQRRAQRIAVTGRADMGRSEQLVAITVTAWERSIGRVKHQVRPFAVPVDPATLAAAVRRLDEVARSWEALQYGAWLTLDWPTSLVLDLSKSHRGRERERTGRRAAGRRVAAARRR